MNNVVLKLDDMTKKTTILSIDGGGIRGILPGVIVAYLEEQLQKRTNNPDARISDFFDLMAGTSTGGILTCMYLAPAEAAAPDAPRRPKFTAQDAVNLYIQNGKQIFSIPLLRRMFNVFGLIEAKFPVNNIEKIIKKYLGDLKLSDALKPCLVTAYEIFQRKTVFFNMANTLTSNTRDFYLRDVARATSAAPTYFRPAEIHSTYGEPLYLVDGGVFANNPSMCAYAEARASQFSHILNRSDKPDYPNATEMILISIGTGSQGDPYPYSKAKNWGVVGWLRPLINILMSGNSETVHYQLKQMFGAADPANTKYYFRLEPTVGTAKSAMDLATTDNMLALEEAGKTFVAANVEELNQIVDLLIENQ